MGAPILSDEEKKRRGTFRADQSDASRKADMVSNVLVFPVLNEIPPCGVAFKKNSKGDQVYNDKCRDLIRAGLLTKISQAWVEQYAMLEQSVADYGEKGKMPPARILELRAASLRKLELLNVDQSIVQGQTKTGAFAQNGFPSRLRLPAEHQAIRTEPGRNAKRRG